ncbi:hypothetical protein CYMTET_46221 [Cymbomonas tetramitiformis]|uniref:AMP-dependent synthetase/ligase domain-containing protein n=1 Tax=Cymbomonas tetramitiformis TaxID=36881 RepID=A0AAE0BWK8_9CHLO|nr:hypothetical protein CYMTET_46221 [Cymbomonas tetramitiformis]
MPGQRSRLLLICLAQNDSELKSYDAWVAQLQAIEVVAITSGDETTVIEQVAAVVGDFKLPWALCAAERSTRSALAVVRGIEKLNSVPSACQLVLISPALLGPSPGDPLVRCRIHGIFSDSADCPEKLRNICEGEITYESLQVHSPLAQLNHNQKEAAASVLDAAAESVFRVLCTLHLARPLHDLVLLQAGLNGDRVAVACGSRSLTYREFCAAAWNLAAHLTEKGLAAKDHVAILINKSAQLPVGYMACLLLRCPFTSLDGRNPEAVLQYQMELWAPRMLLCATKTMLEFDLFWAARQCSSLICAG